MDASSVATAIAAVAILAAAGIAIVVLNLRRTGRITESPNDLQFADRKYIPPEGYVDTNVVKVGKTKTLKSYVAEGSMSWADFFDPKEGQEDKRATAAYMLIGFYVIAGLITVTMSYGRHPWLLLRPTGDGVRDAHHRIQLREGKARVTGSRQAPLIFLRFKNPASQRPIDLTWIQRLCISRYPRRTLRS